MSLKYVAFISVCFTGFSSSSSLALNDKMNQLAQLGPLVEFSQGFSEGLSVEDYALCRWYVSDVTTQYIFDKNISDDQLIFITVMRNGLNVFKASLSEEADLAAVASASEQYKAEKAAVAGKCNQMLLSVMQ